MRNKIFFHFSNSSFFKK